MHRRRRGFGSRSSSSTSAPLRRDGLLALLRFRFLASSTGAARSAAAAGSRKANAQRRAFLLYLVAHVVVGEALEVVSWRDGEAARSGRPCARRIARPATPTGHSPSRRLGGCWRAPSTVPSSASTSSDTSRKASSRIWPAFLLTAPLHHPSLPGSSPRGPRSSRTRSPSAASSTTRPRAVAGTPARPAAAGRSRRARAREAARLRRRVLRQPFEDVGRGRAGRGAVRSRFINGVARRPAQHIRPGAPARGTASAAGC